MEVTAMNDDDVLCSFCGKMQEEVQQLIAGPNVYICNECVTLCQDIITEDRDKELEFPTGKYIHQVLSHHFRGFNKAEIVSCSYETTVTSCPEPLINQWLADKGYKYQKVAISRHYHGRDKFLSFPELWEEKIYPIYLGPTQYFLTGLAGGNKYLENGLWLCSTEQNKFAIYLNQGRENININQRTIHLEIATEANTSRTITDNFFTFIEEQQDKKQPKTSC